MAAWMGVSVKHVRVYLVRANIPMPALKDASWLLSTVECLQASDPTICMSYFPSGAGGRVDSWRRMSGPCVGQAHCLCCTKLSYDSRGAEGIAGEAVDLMRTTVTTEYSIASSPGGKRTTYKVRQTYYQVD